MQTKFSLFIRTVLKNNFLFVAIFAMHIHTIWAQSTFAWVPLDSVPLKADHIHAEPSGSLLFSRGDRVYRLNTKLDTIDFQSMKMGGDITQIWNIQRLRIYVYYKEQLQITILDNSLSVQGQPIDLTEHNYFQISQICPGINNQIWMFDQQSQEIIRLDAQLKPELTTQQMIALTGKSWNPTAMCDLNGELVVADAANGILWFDRFGTLIQTWEVKGVIRLHALTTTMIAETAEGMYLLSPLDQEPKSIPHPCPHAENLSLFATMVFAVKDGKLRRFPLGSTKN